MANFFTGSPGRLKQVSRYTPTQQSALNQLLSGGLGQLQSMQQPGAWGSQFAPLAQQARTQFQQNVIPSIAERFTGMGSNAGSSAFTSALGRAGAGLEQGLAGQQAQFGLQQRGQEQQLLNLLLGMGLQPQFENVYQQGQPGFLQTLLGGLGGGIGSFLGSGNNPLQGLLGLLGGR